MNRWMMVGLAAIAIATAGCSAASSPVGAESPAGIPETAPPTASASASASAQTPAIVGEWVGVHDCARIVPILREAGLEEFVLESVYGNGLVPGVTSEDGLKDPENPCDGAVERKHSHFFTADGRFGSKDFDGQQVDDGTYTLEGDDGIVINGMRFRYEITGDELTLEPEPVDISACTTKECRFGAAWVLMVAMPGMTWTRGEI